MKVILIQRVAFFLGGFVTMPAVSSFALYAAVAVFADFILQITCFMAFLVLDTRRSENSRVDCFPCIRLPIAGRIGHGEGFLHKFFRKVYAPTLMRDWMRQVTALHRLDCKCVYTSI